MTNIKEKMTSTTKTILFAGLIMTLIISVTGINNTAYAGTDDSNKKEIAIEWVNDYTATVSDPDCLSNSNLTWSDIDARGWYNFLGNNGYTKVFDWGDSFAEEADFEKSSVGGSDSSWADNVDMLFFVGHGYNVGNLQFMFGQDNDGGGSNHCVVVSSESEWGDKDLEWITLSSSKTLDSASWTQWISSFKDLHGINGWNDSPNVTQFGGELYACYLVGGTVAGTNCNGQPSDKQSVGLAWKTATIEDEDNIQAATIYGKVTINGVQKNYRTDDFADNMLQDPPNGVYDVFTHTRWNT